MTFKNFFKSLHLPVEKLTVLFLFTVVITLSARAYTQGITLEVKNESLEKVFQEIKKQTGYLFFYENKILANTKKVNLKVSNVTLEEALRLSFQDQPLSYSIVGKTIVVRPKALDNDIESGDKSLQVVTLPIDIKGRLTNDRGEPVEGASIRVKGTDKGTSTNANGEFELKGVDENAVLVISGTNIETVEWKVGGKKELALIAKAKEVIGEEVVVSTGYQDIPKERATGSFVKIDNELLNRRVGSNILNRLEGVTSGLNFEPRNINSPNKSSYTIRGISTINANVRPLIVVDGFPYDESKDNLNLINSLNPNDIEDITILKDAAAASIWGARAGNGVIVITTKKGKYNRKTIIQLNSNLTIGEKPNPFYIPLISPSDEIELEKILFSRNFYNNQINNNNYPALSPVVEILINKRNGQISDTEANTQIESLKKYDTRDDIKKYLFQKLINQQYSLNISGGTDKSSFYGSIGYDKNRSGNIGDQSNRLTIRIENTYKLLRNIELSGFVNYVQIGSRNNSSISIGSFRYTRLKDENYNNLPVAINHRLSYVDTAVSPALLDWHYRPLDELNNNNFSFKGYDTRFGGSLKCNIHSGLNIELRYQYQKILNNSENYYSIQSYVARDLINKYMSINPVDGELFYPFPKGAILDRDNNDLKAWNARGQINYSKSWDKHNFIGLAGIEARQITSAGGGSRLYGYDILTGTYATSINYDSSFRIRPSLVSRMKIPVNTSYAPATLQRFLNYFTNAAYTYRNTYSFSGSLRFDGSNFFGIKANQRIVPLWSAGFLWDITKSGFFHSDVVSLLKFRATYGINGNLYNGVGAYTTIRYSSSDPFSLTTAPYATIQSPPNINLRWEKVKMINLGMDFHIWNERIRGSIEYYIKKGVDLIGPIITDPTTGVNSFTGNRASIKGRGVDVLLSTRNIFGKIEISTNLLFNYNTDKVVSYDGVAKTTSAYANRGGLVIVKGKPLYSIFSYKWGGLNPVNGDPRGFVSDTIASYNTVLSKAKISDLKYHGPQTPRVFGSLMNTIQFNNISLSVNIVYKFNYFFRRNSIEYSSLFSSWSGHSDYALRWTKPGDEVFTNVPSLPTSSNANRDFMYLASDVLVQKGDHIRLQDVRISYDFVKSSLKKFPFQNLQIYCYTNNLGILWRANKYSIDPDYGDQAMPNPRSIAVGLKLSL
ncbi:MAG: SusC/RagA family TonB-linked outer membrane protein [Chitinophagales bacterium]|nr:SusC/RagA family TonB-linked outer membrane protein [Chitinophagales bacterium]